MSGSPARPWLARLGVAAAVVLVHVALVGLIDRELSFDAQERSRPERLQVAFVVDLLPAEPQSVATTAIAAAVPLPARASQQPREATGRRARTDAGVAAAGSARSALAKATTLPPVEPKKAAAERVPDGRSSPGAASASRDRDDGETTDITEASDTSNTGGASDASDASDPAEPGDTSHASDTGEPGDTGHASDGTDASFAGDADTWADAAVPTSAGDAPEMPVDSRPPPLAADETGSRGDAQSPQTPAVSSAPDPFDWPPSTQLSYVLTGNYRGELHGTAQVQWIRIDDRYQVHVDVIVGLPFAPLLRREMTSDGSLGAEGLTPRRFDERTSRVFASSRLRTVRFDDSGVRLANGARRATWPGVQDAASQFVQLTWLFSTKRAQLQVGQSVEMPLALPHSVDRWTFDVVALETLHTPMGALEAFHLKPRRTARPADALSAEVWIAPSLRNLPVRIRIEQDAETHIDLMLRRPPRQAAGEPPSAGRPDQRDGIVN